MKLLLGMLILSAALFSEDDLSSFLHAYKQGDSESTCRFGRQLYRANIRDENILIAAGQACAKEDFIDFVSVLQQRLGKSPESRQAAVYFSSLVLQKRLIFQFMLEDVDLSPYALPVTDHILSRVFEAIKNGEYSLIAERPKHIQIGTQEDFLDVYITKKVCVDHYKDNKKIREHRYR